MTRQSDAKNDLWAFREGRKAVRGSELLADLAKAAHQLRTHPHDGRIAISALMRAGEFETAMADANSGSQATAQQLTDALAGAFLGDRAENGQIMPLLRMLAHSEVPEHLHVSPPEGFAYYALHPHDFARLADEVENRCDSAVVIGIRTIGTTLSAIVAAALKGQGKETARMTVRPTGHPYDRLARFTPAHLQTIADWNARGAYFFIVDEGPGRSGSSFLSVAEALAKTGIAAHRIKLLGSRPVDVGQLCAENARERWSQFQFLWPKPSVYGRFSDHIYIGGGNWRGTLTGTESDWPECWPQMERLKFLSPDRRAIFKFEGFGHFGEEVLSRARVLFHAGFGSYAEDAGDGMILYPALQGSSAHAGDVSTSVLRTLAEYCALRSAEFRSPGSAPTQLPAMLRFNANQEFGVELGPELEELHTSAPILADGRMQPHEWIRTADNRLLKVDACTHGDDHFFPGPTDIAWDLAGTIVEWNLDRNATEFFLSEFRRVSGMDRADVIRIFILAYTIFRLAYNKMALSTVQGSPEEPRLKSAYLRYRSLAQDHLREMRTPNTTTAPTALLDSSVQPGTAV